ncbi:ABC-F family ATP-binding cassette domain-containing protein [Cryobacterium frigoriphilum]|uniref:ABC-F family ATP-binding cassette domain-containing protein n=1 Tax=Cryobacterium frigoriphilum TaxID=1259150 RepID=A0A4R9A264_9MICO|nr:ABC-F family ATP-binding cassette domain-containing protein [Cryobacterium frigoriphilum]TFD50611.1 ABC-F family ATP-binding cassette domain-containing protein [Cryobacterium frigoriphilum]
MSATLVARGLAGGYGHRTLFDNLDLSVAPGDVIGVVGVNGSGKSTLLNLLAGVTEPQAGTVTISPTDAFIGALPQEHDRLPGETIAGYIGRRTGCAAATADMDAAAEALGDPNPPPRADGRDPADVYSSALDRWLASGAADLDERLPQVLAELGLALADATPTAPGGPGSPAHAAGSAVSAETLMTALSGGQAARVGLAALLLSRFDVVLLDEPTNDLDLDGLERLETFVRGLRGGVVLVSHDREFLARCVTRVLELDLGQGSNRLFGGGYDSYLEERATARRHKREEFDEFAAKKADLVGRARTQREWSSQGVRNAIKKAPDNDKIRRKASVESSEKQAQKVRQMESRIARLDEVDEPRKEWQLEFTIGAAPRSSTVVSTLNGAVFRQGDFVLGPVSLQINVGDRIGITGRNGAGKTTLLRALLGRQSADAGSAHLGSNVTIGEIDQARSLIDGDEPLAASLEALLPDLSPAEVRTLLAKFGLKADHVNRPAGELSPGERTRAGLALLQAQGVNLLVLDEPTNHLDLAAIEQLEQALEHYEGTLLLVTHDRRMLDAVRIDRHWRVAGGQVTEA